MKKALLSVISAAVLLVTGCSSGISQESYNSVVEENSRLQSEKSAMESENPSMSGEKSSLESENVALKSENDQLREEKYQFVTISELEK